MTFDVNKARALATGWGADYGDYRAALEEACDYIDHLEKVRSLTASLMSEDGAMEALAHYNVLHALADALKECEEKA